MSLKEQYLTNEISINMSNPEWIHHIYKHKQFIKNGSDLIEIPLHLLAIYQARPIAALKEMPEVPNNFILETLLVNSISRTTGFEPHHDKIYVPDEDMIESLTQSFQR